MDSRSSVNSFGRPLIVVSIWKSDVFALKNQSLLRPALFWFVPPKPTAMRRPSEQMVKTIGVKIHANLPTLPMMTFLWVVANERGCEWEKLVLMDVGCQAENDGDELTVKMKNV